MYRGKNRCRILKEIRQKIADENDIPYVTSECKHKGDCAGTCPKCESELRYLEDELRKRRALGTKVSVAGVALAVSLSTTSCALMDDLKSETLEGDMMVEGTDNVFEDDSVTGNDISDGENDEIEVGELPEEENVEEDVLMGDMPIDYEETAGEPMP